MAERRSRPYRRRLTGSLDRGGDGTVTSLDTLHALVSALVAKWHQLDDARRLALVREIELTAIALLRHPRQQMDDLESDRGSLIDDPLLLLTPRELEVLWSIANGETTKMIATRLAITQLTVRSHVKNLLGKLGVHSRLEAASAFLRFGPTNNLGDNGASTWTELESEQEH
jgi:DNA-binding NarL/FixJ family response regulator